MNGRRQMGPINRPAELAAWVMMGNNQKGKCALLVEGKRDVHALLLFVDGQSCRFIKTEGKAHVLDAMDILRSRGYTKAFAVVDADFDHFSTQTPKFSDLARTDKHDIETMILATTAVQKVLLRYGYWALGSTEVNVEDIERSCNEFLERLLKAGLRLAYLRWASQIYNLRIRFKDMELFKVVDPSTLSIREDRLEEAVLRASQSGTWSEIKSKADALVDPEHDPMQVCNGHDLTTFLALHLGRKTATTVTQGNVEKDLSMAYTREDFRATKLFAQIVAWQEANHPLRILKL
jgi:hypothetical protein